METIRLALRGLDGMSPRLRSEIVVIVRNEFEPLTQAAGMRLQLTTGDAHGDLTITFDTASPPAKPCGTTILAEEAGGNVWVQSHLNLRVCGPPDPKTGKQDTRPFLTNSWLQARALANTALHELGHFIADLPHSSDLGNYMFTIGIPREERTMKSQREVWAGVKTFTPEQKEKLVTQLKLKQWQGEMTIEYH